MINYIMPIFPEIFIVLSSISMLFISGSLKKLVNQFSFTLVFLIITLVLLLTNESSGAFFNDFIIIDHATIFAKLIIVITSIAVIFLTRGFYNNYQGLVAEYSSIFLLSVLGMLLMISSNNFLSLYLGLELQSLALYLLAAIHRDDSHSSEAGLKYFILGALSSGMLLFGISLIYGFSGVFSFNEISTYYISNNGEVSVGFLVGLILFLVAFFFKISAAPFHMWAPDVYQGSPMPVTLFFATVPKFASVFILSKILLESFFEFSGQWQQIIIIVSVISMIVGALGAIKQSNIKRLLAFSSIGHVGFILIGLAATSSEGFESILLYLVVYLSISLAAFACILLIRNKGEILEDITQFSGLSKSNPLLALSFSIILFSMAGIPPFAGFFAKFFILVAAVNQGLYALSIIAVITSVLSTFYYLRIIKIMYFEASKGFDKFSDRNIFVILFVSVLLNVFFFAISSDVLEYMKEISSNIF